MASEEAIVQLKEKMNMFTVGGAMLVSNKAVISGYILGVSAFFALQHSYGFLQSAYSGNKSAIEKHQFMK